MNESLLYKFLPMIQYKLINLSLSNKQLTKQAMTPQIQRGKIIILSRDESEMRLEKNTLLKYALFQYQSGHYYNLVKKYLITCLMCTQC